VVAALDWTAGLLAGKTRGGAERIWAIPPPAVSQRHPFSCCALAPACGCGQSSCWAQQLPHLEMGSGACEGTAMLGHYRTDPPRRLPLSYAASMAAADV